jgi:hypothetical protein
MENVVTNFESPEISIKLTDEKLYITTLSSSETFALRSINGIGVVDLVEIYNQELSAYNTKKNAPIAYYIIGGIFLLGGLANFSKDAGAAIMGLVLGGGIMYWGSTKQAVEPSLQSAVRIMISGMNRDFEFDKSGSYTNQIAELVVKVEETLTAYHKKNK